jgi:hypothetical protein
MPEIPVSPALPPMVYFSYPIHGGYMEPTWVVPLAQELQKVGVEAFRPREHNPFSPQREPGSLDPLPPSIRRLVEHKLKIRVDEELSTFEESVYASLRLAFRIFTNKVGKDTRWNDVGENVKPVIEAEYASRLSDLEGWDPGKIPASVNNILIDLDLFLIASSRAIFVDLRTPSVGAAQEILYARYFHKPVIGIVKANKFPSIWGTFHVDAALDSQYVEDNAGNLVHDISPILGF